MIAKEIFLEWYCKNNNKCVSYYFNLYSYFNLKITIQNEKIFLILSFLCQK
jgi:hypothetical protein